MPTLSKSYCAIHADAHKHHIKQIVHLTYARPMCCVYSTRFTFPRSLPFLPKLTQFFKEAHLGGTYGHHSHGCFYEGSHRIHRYKTFGEWTPFGETLWNIWHPNCRKGAATICIHVLYGGMDAGISWMGWFPMIPTSAHFSDRCHGKSWQSSAWSGCVQCLSSLTFLWQWAVGTGQVEIHLKISQMPGDFRRTKGLNGFWRFQHSLAQLSVSRDHFLLLLSHVRQWPWHVKSS